MRFGERRLLAKLDYSSLSDISLLSPLSSSQVSKIWNWSLIINLMFEEKFLSAYVRSCWHLRRQLGVVRQSVSKAVLTSMVHTLVCGLTDWCNSANCYCNLTMYNSNSLNYYRKPTNYYRKLLNSINLYCISMNSYCNSMNSYCNSTKYYCKLDKFIL